MGIETIIGLALTVGATAYGTNESRQQAREQRDAVRDQENEQKALITAQSQEKANIDKQASEQQAQLQNRQRAIASGYQRAAGQTTFTSPLGLPGGASNTNGSLLGL